MLGHVAYEIGTFRCAGYLLHYEFFKGTPLSDALLESFLIHTRYLIEFFYEVGVEKDDVVAAELFDDPRQWRIARGKQDKVLRDLPRRANKQLAHLTWKRLDVTKVEKEWKITEIIIAMERAISLLEAQVSRSSALEPLQVAPPPLTEELTGGYKTIGGTPSTAISVSLTEIGKAFGKARE